jgi:quinoprotein glucose dehydrogenase
METNVGQEMKALRSRSRTTRICVAFVACALGLCVPRPSTAAQPAATDADWAYYGRDAGGQRFSPLTQIDRRNVSRLTLAWTFHTGDIADGHDGPRSGLETTPLFIDGRLYLTTAFNRVIALDPASGRQLWAFDPHIDRDAPYGDGFINRGVAAWRAPGPADRQCALRLFEATLDDRLVAIDAATGRPCAGFGQDGEVRLTDVARFRPGAYHMTSPPAVVDGVVIVGSAIDDNSRVDMPSGVVRGYDALTGALRWTWQPLEHRPGTRSGAANAWSIMTVDPARHLVFVPTGSASPDYYGGLRPGDDRWSDSVVALDSRTGRLVWGFQLVHHDLWDYDTATPPLLAELPVGGRMRAVVIVASKSGYLYVLDRDTGRPVFPVEERPVPASDVPGEQASPTQPVSIGLPALAPQRLRPEDAFGLTDADRAACRAQISAASGASVFSPPSLTGTISVPGNIGGANWSGFSYDPDNHLLIVNASNLPFFVRLIPADRLAASGAENLRGEIAPQTGAPYGMSRAPLRAPSGVPCMPPPWGELMAIDMTKGEIRWRRPLGTMAEISAALDREGLGSISLGGTIATAGGLIFVGGTLDRRFRAFDAATGALLWSAELPASAHATPMTFEANGRQYVVIAAGGAAHISEERQSDSILAFALPE